jgi:hypothetical protein
MRSSFCAVFVLAVTLLASCSEDAASEVSGLGELWVNPAAAAQVVEARAPVVAVNRSVQGALFPTAILVDSRVHEPLLTCIATGSCQVCGAPAAL